MQYDMNTIKRLLVAACGLLLVAGCTSSDSFVQSVRPLYQTQGEATEPSYYSAGKQYFSEGRYGLALEAFRAELNRNQHSVPALNGIAACYDKLKRYDLALSYYYKALQIQPDSVKTLGNLGYSYMLQGRIQEADKVLRLALHYNPESAVIRQHLANIAEEYPAMADNSVAETPLEQAAEAGQLRPDAAGQGQAVAGEIAVPEVQSVEQAGEGNRVAEKKLDIPAGAEHAAANIEQPASTLPVEQTASDIAAHEAPDTEPTSGQNKAGPGMFDSIATFFKSVGEKVLAAISPEEQAASSAVVTAETPYVTSSAKPEQAEGQSIDLHAVEAELVSESSEPAVEATAELAPSAVEAVEARDIVDDSRHELPQAKATGVETVTVMQAATQPSVEETAARDRRQAVVRPQAEALITEAAVPGKEPARADRGGRVEVSNGNGTPGHAHLLAIYLKGQGELVWRITNADSFDYENSVIFYRPGNRLDAERLAHKLPVEVTLKESTENYPGIAARLVLGEELVAYRASISSQVEQMQAASLYAQNYNFSDKPVVVLAIEVSNGNGTNGMARLLRDVLSKQGKNITRVTNADSFGYEKTVIYYQPGRLQDALQVASQLPVEARLEETDISRRNVNLRIIMGKDIVNFRAAMELLVAEDA